MGQKARLAEQGCPSGYLVRKRKCMDFESMVRLHRMTTDVLFATVERKYVWLKLSWS